MKSRSIAWVLLAVAGAAVHCANAADGSVKNMHADNLVSLNPQPEPPGINAKIRTVRGAVQRNPQPEPPGVAAPKAKQAKAGASSPGTAAQATSK